MIWTMGMGKSAVAAQLLALDLCTMGVPAAFIEGGQILHGGIGGIKLLDTVYFFSESGETKELVEAARILRAEVGCRMVLVGATGKCSLSEICEPAVTATGVSMDTDTPRLVALARGIARHFLADQKSQPDWAHPANRKGG